MTKKLLFLVAAAATLWPGCPAPLGLLMGIAFGLGLGNPFAAETKRVSPRILQGSIIALGAGMNLGPILQAGSHGVLFTAIGILGTFVVGEGLRRLLGTERETTWLITMGTAICGGSAIAALAPVIRAREESIAAALATVFVLNALALLIFPPIGHALGLGQIAFGYWSAIAVHDTSSVVGTAAQYGAEALAIATPVKLARTLWIIPIVLAFSARAANADAGTSAGWRAIKWPWFILGFLGSAALVTAVPQLRPFGAMVARAGRQTLVTALFLIGCGVSAPMLRRMGPRPFALGVLLWAFVAAASLALGPLLV